MRASYQLKVDRGLELFRPLRDEIDVFASSRPFTIEHTIRPAAPEEVRAFAAVPEQLPGRLRITPERTDLIAHEARITFTREPPLEQWSLRVSEIVQHLRSSLDNLAYHLAVMHSGSLSPKTAKQIHFPICQDQSEWPNAARRLAPLDKRHVAQIETFQPYHVEKRPSPNWGLHILQHFNNHDKHRSLFMVGAKPTSISVEGLQTLEDGYTPKTQLALGALESGTVIALCLSPVEFPQFKIGDSYALELALPNVPLPEGNAHLSVTATLGTVGHCVNEVIAALDGTRR